MISNEIKNIIFDLGGVIMDLDVSKTHHAFAELAGLPVHDLKSKIASATFFNEYEKGLIDNGEFHSCLRSFLSPATTDQQLDFAWNAMLLEIVKEKFDLLLKLKSRYNTFLLSNTNDIHLKAVNETVLKTSGKPTLDPFFHKAYFSHLMRMRKPDQEIFNFVLNENNLKPGETLFLDDLAENIQGAKSTGIQTIQIISSDQILSLFA